MMTLRVSTSSLHQFVPEGNGKGKAVPNDGVVGARKVVVEVFNVVVCDATGGRVHLLANECVEAEARQGIIGTDSCGRRAFGDCTRRLT